jgi:hypothetical protein
LIRVVAKARGPRGLCVFFYEEKKTTVALSIMELPFLARTLIGDRREGGAFVESATYSRLVDGRFLCSCLGETPDTRR